MTDKTDDPGRGPPRPGDRRPYATLDLKATEIGRTGAAPGGAPGDSSDEGSGGRRQWWAAGAQILRWPAAVAAWLAAAGAWLLRLVRSNELLSHVAAGAAGAAITLAMAALLGLLSGNRPLPPDLAQRLTAVEQAQAKPPSLPNSSATDTLAALDKRLAGVEEQAKAIADLKSEQAKLAAAAKALEARTVAPDTADRIARLESAVANLRADGAKPGMSGISPDKLADLERLSAEAGRMKAAAAQLERDLAALKAETAGARQSLEALKASVEEAILTRLAGVERDLHTFKKTAEERVAGARRVLLALEIANLKRAVDRGGSYARELEAAKKAAGGAVDLAPLDKSSTTGVPTLATLAKEFKGVIHAALDAEAERADASVLDRLTAGARSVVRLRKTQHAPEDASAEAVLTRMETALKEGNVGEAVAQSKRLPPKAAAAAAGWIARLEARYTADKALAEVEAGLKASLSGPGVAPEPKR